MAGVVSVEHHTITLGDGVGSNTADLSGTIDTGNCVPYVTHRVTTPALTPEVQNNYNVLVDFVAGTPDKVRVQTGLSADRIVVCEVFVVEYDGSDIVVDSGTYAMGINDLFVVPTAPADMGASYATEAYLYHTWQSITASSDWWEECNIMGEMTGSAALRFERADNGPAIDGRWWTIRSPSETIFSVQQHELLMDTGVSATVNLSPNAALDKTFLMGSTQGGDQDDNNAGTFFGLIWDDADQRKIVVERSSTDKTLTWHGYAITFAGSESVQRGTVLVDDGATQPTEISITAIDKTRSIVIAAGNVGCANAGLFQGTLANYVQDAPTSWKFKDSVSNTIEFQHYDGPAADNDHSWEVIQFVLGAAPVATRRVMVR